MRSRKIITRSRMRSAKQGCGVSLPLNNFGRLCGGILNAADVACPPPPNFFAMAETSTPPFRLLLKEQ